MSSRWIVVAVVSIGLLWALSFSSCIDRAPTEAAEALALDATQLATKLRECRRQIVPSADQTCQLASEAWRRRFLAGSTNELEPRAGTGNAPASASESSTKSEGSTPREHGL